MGADNGDFILTPWNDAIYGVQNEAEEIGLSQIP